ncbi:hypothetical protein LCGC14_0870480 [marine sediment metagenome]|uniref:Uncharacterized protein n=1 Tax=marine sediment metagenome TaxID=412755 RepID=A0A0F9SBU1_9ZZZZ
MVDGKIGHGTLGLKMSEGMKMNMMDRDAKVEFLNGKVREVKRKIAARKIANKLDNLGMI